MATKTPIKTSPSTKAPQKKPTAKPAPKVTTKSTAVKAAKADTKWVQPVQQPVDALEAASAKQPKAKKPKMVRDSFTMPKSEFVVIDALKLRAVHLKKPAKKTELIRAGIKALVAMSDTAFLAAIGAVPNLKTGRPRKV